MPDTVLSDQIQNTFLNLSTGMLYEHIVRRKEGKISKLGALVVHTGARTGRSPNDKFIVMDPSSAEKISWGSINRPIEMERFEGLLRRIEAYLQGRDVYVQECYAGTDPDYQLPITVITETAWQSLFARNMFVRRVSEEPTEFTIISVPNFHANPEIDGTNSEAFVIINFAKKIVLIGGTGYAGEIKKSVFTIMNYLLPQKGILSMHCSANTGSNGSSAIFFGLSGTGKTTLSADPERRLIGDDEHGWGPNGVFNIENGCYAKVIRLSEKDEPDIYEASQRFGTIVENASIDEESRLIDLDDATITENTRAAYPVASIHNVELSGLGNHPDNVIMLTTDAFGVLPPVSKLTLEQTIYHFLSGYTAKIAGTEEGLGMAPQATFSTCFGAPFMILPPLTYAKLLSNQLEKRHTECWLVNTGWTGGPYGIGNRIKIDHTRAIIKSILNGTLREVETDSDPIFNIQVPRSCPGVPDMLLRMSETWADQSAYQTQALELAARFKQNFDQFSDVIETTVLQAGPK